MGCLSCGCKVHYQFNTERLERCAACCALSDIADAAEDEDDGASPPMDRTGEIGKA